VQRTEAGSICIVNMLRNFGVIYTMVDPNLKGYPGIPINILSDLFGSVEAKKTMLIYPARRFVVLNFPSIYVCMFTLCLWLCHSTDSRASKIIET
jgi:hypothetical protein